VPAPTATEEALLSDIPIIEGAEIERSGSGTVEYRVPMELADVVEFYQAQLPEQGWEESSKPYLVQIIATLRYKKEVEGKPVSLTVGLQYNENSQTTLVRLFWQ
jgi:Mor family transcriptional regulator